MKYTNIVFPAAVYLSAGSEVYQNIFDLDETTMVHNADEALKYIKGDTILSQNQKNALYLYMSLYAKLAKIHIQKVDFVKDAFGITSMNDNARKMTPI